MTTLAALSPAPNPGATSGTNRPLAPDAGWRYGLMGFPLAFVALPLYVVLPHFYAQSFGVSLAVLGALLLGVRMLDAVIDPLLGRWCDRLHAHSTTLALRWAAVLSVALALGFVSLFFPPVQEMPLLLAWAAAGLLLTTISYSALSILHQSWGARWGGDAVQRSRIVAWREGCGVLGVVTASVAPGVLGWTGTSLLFAAALACGLAAWRRAPSPDFSGVLPARAALASTASALWHPFSQARFRRLLLVFLVNGIASAVPATLVLFFVQDRLQAPISQQSLFLGAYFLSAALAIPLWLRCVPRIGLGRTWGVGMVLSVATFLFAAQLGPGDTAAFVAVCVLSGVALGTDLALPAALLAGVIAEQGDQGQSEGLYFGWWNFVTKLNLALAAGLALPALQAWGYVPGARHEEALQALTFAYCLLPCALKLLAASLLYGLILRKEP